MLRQSLKINVDFNGIVIFSYPEITNYFEGKIQNGQNILQEFTTTDLGDKVMDDGVVIPIINIDDGGYLIRIFDSPNTDKNKKIIFSTPGYILDLRNKLYIADAAVFWDWEEYLGWEEIYLEPGKYEVSIEGVQHFDNNKNITAAGYDIVFKRVHELPSRSATPPENSRVLF